MSRLITTLFGFNRDIATPEEAEAYRVANEAHQYRTNMIARQGNRAKFFNYPTTDAFGRALR